MVLDLRGKKVVVIGGKQSVGRAIAEAVAREGAQPIGRVQILLTVNPFELPATSSLPVTLRTPSGVWVGRSPSTGR